MDTPSRALGVPGPMQHLITPTEAIQCTLKTFENVVNTTLLSSGKHIYPLTIPLKQINQALAGHFAFLECLKCFYIS